MKKKSLVIVLSLVMVLLASSVAFAAQAYYTVGGKVYFSSTTVSTLSQTYSVTYDGLSRLKASNKFSNDNETHYPYEIYLPNESAPASYRIHSNYTRSTDACASCHATHTAVGPSLLQWYTVYEACIACHDGTVTSTYNVVSGKIGTGNPTYGGMFGLGTEGSLSNHNVTGAVEIAAAPGGTVTAHSVTKGYGVNTIMWQTTFGCESCHTPHGQGGNARILSPDPNGYATEYNSKTGLDIDANGAILDNSNKVAIITGYPYLVVITYNGVNVAGTVNDNYVVKNDGYDSVAKTAYSYLKRKDGASITGGEVTALNNAGISAVIGYTVQMQIDNYLNPANEKVRHVSGINAFCGACHVDYNTEPYVKSKNTEDVIMGNKTQRPGYVPETGEFSKAHRHAVGLKWNYANAADTGYIGWANKPMMTVGKGENGSEGSANASTASYISCLTCHFAHGTSEDFWGRWINGQTWTAGIGAWDNAELKEISGSSALKRLPNMGTCEACHQKGVDAAGYNINTGNPDFANLAATVQEGIFKLGNYNTLTITNNTCEAVGCHNGMLAKFTATKMGDNVSCEKCHIKDEAANSSGNHAIQPSANNINNPRNLRIVGEPGEFVQSDVCLSCHDGSDAAAAAAGADNISASWSSDPHEGSGVVSCTTCHDAHKLSSEGISLKREYNALCASCHDKTYTLSSPYHD